MVQWHPTILTKLSLIPPRILNAYNIQVDSRGGKDVMYREEDFVVRAVGCEKDQNRHCDKEIDPMYNLWRNSLAKRNEGISGAY